MRSSLAILTILALTIPAMAETVRVDCIGSVEYSQVNQGIFADVNSGDAVLATFTIDSDEYIDSDAYGVRSYPVDLASFELTIGSVGPVGLVIPQPDGLTTYFNLRNDDPAADGFFVANDREWPTVFPSVDVPGGIDPYFNFHWEVGYEGDVLSSLDVIDAVGSYDYTGLTSFYTVIGDAWADAIGLEYVQMVITLEGVATESRSWSGVKNLFD